jgi:hypothetical protein
LKESLGEFDAAKAGGKEDGNAGAIHQVQVNARIAQGQRRGHQRPRRKTIQPPVFNPGTMFWRDGTARPEMRGAIQGVVQAVMALGAPRLPQGSSPASGP